MNKYICNQGYPIHGPYRFIVEDEYKGLVETAKSRASMTPDWGFKGRWDGDEGYYLEDRHVPGICGEWYMRDLLPDAEPHKNELDRHDLVWKNQIIEVKTFGKNNSWCNFYERDKGKQFDWLYVFTYNPDIKLIACCGYIHRKNLVTDQNYSDDLPLVVGNVKSQTTGWKVPFSKLTPHGEGPLFNKEGFSNARYV